MPGTVLGIEKKAYGENGQINMTPKGPIACSNGSPTSVGLRTIWIIYLNMEPWTSLLQILVQ